MLEIDIVALQAKLDKLVLQRKRLVAKRKSYIDFRDLAFKRHTQFTYAQRLMVRTNLGLEWGLRFLSQHQNDLLQERINIKNNIAKWAKNPDLVLLNKKALVKNWETWVAVQSKFQKLQWWVHTHERILLNCRLKLMKNQEILEKILRDIMSIEIQARKLVVNTIEMVDYDELSWELEDKKKNPQGIWDKLYIYWYSNKKFLTTEEWEYNRLICERKILMKEQGVLLGKLEKITKAEYYIAVRQEETADEWDTLSGWHGHNLNKQFWYLKRERWHFSDLRRIIFNPKYYWEDYNELGLIEWDLDQYVDYLWDNREELQYYQPHLTKARLKGQYYLQLLKETQVDLMKNQADIINLQESFFKKFQQAANKYYRITKRVSRKINKKVDTNFHYKKFIISVIETLPDKKYYRWEKFPYLIKILLLRRIELPFNSLSPHRIHYYNNINNSSGEEQYLFFSIKLPFPFVSHWGILIYISNEDSEYRRGPWWKWRSIFEICYEWSLQKPINILRELIFGSEHIDSYYRWGDHYSVDEKFKDDLYLYENFKFDKNFYSQLNEYRNSYYTTVVGDELGHPGECDLRKDFGTYYYHTNNSTIGSEGVGNNIDDILGLNYNTKKHINLDDEFANIFNEKFEEKLNNFFFVYENSEKKTPNNFTDKLRALKDIEDYYTSNIFEIIVCLAKEVDEEFKKISRPLYNLHKDSDSVNIRLNIVSRNIRRKYYYSGKKN